MASPEKSFYALLYFETANHIHDNGAVIANQEDVFANAGRVRNLLDQRPTPVSTIEDLIIHAATAAPKKMLPVNPQRPQTEHHEALHLYSTSELFKHTYAIPCRTALVLVELLQDGTKHDILKAAVFTRPATALAFKAVPPVHPPDPSFQRKTLSVLSKLNYQSTSAKIQSWETVVRESLDNDSSKHKLYFCQVEKHPDGNQSWKLE